jgi:hypothetical protein
MSLAKSDDGKSQESMDLCFTIMPFGFYHDSYYENIYKPAIIEAGLKPVRADDFYRSGAIIRDIWDCTKKAKIILADLTDRNPNVLYELGLAHAITKPAILIAQTIEEVPFDLRQLRVITYDKNQHDWGETLRKTITKYLIESINAPMFSILPVFLPVDESTRGENISVSELELIELRQDIQFLKQELFSHNSINNPITRELANRFSETTPESNEKNTKKLIWEMLNSGLQEDEIIHRVSMMGWDESWIQSKLDAFSGTIRGKTQKK